ncbi:MAG TPA: tetraacyldisaccharide 4'-kinase [Candidatus Kapabacteria bacterium]|nr:tetraacyldisaccharide 4'-kinase [Candidatus Kapabacteria bacterium]
MPFLDYLNPYAYTMRLRRLAYERGWLPSYHPGIPVISVGNLTLGGTGKSPLVLLIADHLEKKHGKRVAIISRGYKRHSKGFVLVRDGKDILALVEDSGDEAQMFAVEAPNAIVIVDEDRARGAREAKALGAEVIVLDDGFQHLRLRRDLNILLLGGKPSPVIPFGRMREPESAAQAADIVIFSEGVNSVDAVDEDGRTNAIIRSVPGNISSLEDSEVPLSNLKGKRVQALSSIASPKGFHEMLRGLGADVIARDLGDHADYSEALVQNILKDAEKSNAEMIVTTMKDIVKSRKHFERAASSIPIFILHHKREFLRGEAGFYQAIDRIL